jgi:hypothetical protein
MTSWLIFKPVSLAYFLAGGNNHLSSVTSRWFCIPVHGCWFAYAAWATATKNNAGNDHQSNDEHGNTLHGLSSLMLLTGWAA